MFLLCHCRALEVCGKVTGVVRADVKKTCVPKAAVPTCCAEPAPRLRDSPEQETCRVWLVLLCHSGID